MILRLKPRESRPPPDLLTTDTSAETNPSFEEFKAPERLTLGRFFFAQVIDKRGERREHDVTRKCRLCERVRRCRMLVKERVLYLQRRHRETEEPKRDLPRPRRRWNVAVVEPEPAEQQ